MSTVDLISKKRKIDFLKISGIDNTFTFSGTQVFSWIGERPENNDLAYKIRVGTFQEPKSNLYTANSASRLSAIEVPETKTISLFSLLLVGMVFTHLRR